MLSSRLPIVSAVAMALVGGNPLAAAPLAAWLAESLSCDAGPLRCAGALALSVALALAFAVGVFVGFAGGVVLIDLLGGWPRP